MKLQIQKKHLSAAIALALTLTIAATLVTASPIVFGQFLPNARQVDVFAYAAPNIVGKGQSTFITGWVYPAPSNTSESYHGLKFTFKKPDGTSFNVTRDSFLAGTVEYSLIPDQVGNWSVTLWLPGDLKYLN